MCRKINPLKVYLSLHKTTLSNAQQLGVSFVELLIMTLFLTGIAFSTAFLVTRSKTSMKSVSQTGHCPILAKEMLEQFASFGTRLYGYSYDGSLAHQPHHPKVRPLLIMPDTGASPPGIKDVAGHSRSTPYPSQLKFPGIFQNTLQDLSMTISPGSDGDWVNTGVDIIKMHNNKIELGSSVFIINTANILQYLYNSDSTYFTGTRQGSTEVWGKMWSTMGSNSALEKYKKQYDLNDLKVYLLIRPVELDTGQHNVLTTETDVANKCQSATASGNTLTTTSYTCPQDGSHYLLLTRPRLAANVIRKIPSYVILHGNPHLGFELKVTIEYQKSGSSEDLYCDTMQTFTHQMDSIDRLQEPSHIPLLSLKNAAPTPRDLLATPVPIVNPEDTTDTINKSTISNDVPELVSCDTDGTGYEDIILELDIGNLQADPNTEKGTLLLCQGVSACVSGDSLQSYPGCSYQAGNWQRCHQVTFPGQTTTTKASLASNKLKLTFEDLPPNRRYDLNLAEMSMSGTVSYQKTIARFYLDAKRPEIKSRAVKGDDVGGPLDQVKGRDYQAHHKTSPGVSWDKPSDAVGGKWLQCNQADVEFTSQIEDQFMHNLRPCKRTAKRKDGSGTTDQTSNLNTLGLTTNINDVTGKDFKKCNGTYSSIQHGRQMMTLESYDSCQVTVGPPPVFKKVNEKKIEWDTDLPSTFAPKDFTSDPIWFKNSKGPSYTVDAILPASGAGEFPKHYSMDCWEEYWGPSSGNTRPDGHDTTISCNLKTSTTKIDDGCNPNAIGIDYWHVCGGSKQNKESNWGVYTPYKNSCPSGGTCSCQNVRCEPQLICCDGDNGAGQTSPPPCGTIGGSSMRGYCATNSYSTSCGDPKGGPNSQQDNASNCPPLGLYQCNYSAKCDGNNPYHKDSPGTTPCYGKRGGENCQFTDPGTCHPHAGTGTFENQPSGAGTCRFSGTSWTKSCSCPVIPFCDYGHDEDYDCNCHSCNCSTCTDSNGNTYSCNCSTCCSTCTRFVCDDYDYTLNSCGCSQLVTGVCHPMQGSCPKKTHLSLTRNDTTEICEVASSNKTRVPAQSTAVDGDCGSNPTPHICVQGTAGAVSGSCTKTWTCAGSNGGSSTSCTHTETCCPGSGTYPTLANCQANAVGTQTCIQSGQCYVITNSPVCDSPETCNTGSSVIDKLDGVCTADPNKQCFKWSCRRNSITQDCEEEKEEPGCGTACLTCQPGIPDDGAVPDTNTHVKWRCTHNSMDTDLCEATKASCDLCDNSQKLGCRPGTADDNVIPDTTTHIKWRCSYNRRNVDTCQCERTTCDNNGKCDLATAYGCLSPQGATNKVGNLPEKWTWTCEGNGGTDASCFKCKDNYQLNAAGTDCEPTTTSTTTTTLPPNQCGCDNTKKDSCSTPCTSKDEGIKSDTQFKWICEENTHTDSSECTFNCPSGQYTSKTACDNNKPTGAICNNSPESSGCYAYTTTTPTCACDNSSVDGCASPCTASQTPGDTDTEFKWTCTEGSHTDSPTCTKTCPSNQYTSKSACDNNKPTGATCNNSPESSGCYAYTTTTPTCACDNSSVDGCASPCTASQTPGDTDTEFKWTCTEGSHTDSPTCTKSCPSDQYTSNAVCVSAIANARDCLLQNSSGCYALFACDPGYTQNGNRCTFYCPDPDEYTSNSDCVNAISNAQSCSQQANGCYTLNTCQNGYIKESNQCVSPVCNNAGCSSCAGSSGTDSACCSRGAFHGTPGDTATHWNWRCGASTSNPVNADYCSCAKPTTPTPTPTKSCSCGGTLQSCTASDGSNNCTAYTTHNGVTYTNYWVCDGTNYQHSSLCSVTPTITTTTTTTLPQFKSVCSFTSFANQNMCGCCDRVNAADDSLATNGTCAGSGGGSYTCLKDNGDESNDSHWVSCGGSSCTDRPCRWKCPDALSGEDPNDWCMNINYTGGPIGICQ